MARIVVTEGSIVHEDVMTLNQEAREQLAAFVTTVVSYTSVTHTTSCPPPCLLPFPPPRFQRLTYRDTPRSERDTDKNHDAKN